MPKNPIGFSVKTFGFTSKVQIKQEVISALQSSPQLRAEIRRVFQMANRRIQNIEKAGLVSPAVTALNKGDVKGFTKFSMRMSWEDLKIEYEIQKIGITSRFFFIRTNLTTLDSHMSLQTFNILSIFSMSQHRSSFL